MLCRKSLHESCTMGRRLVVVKLMCSLGHCECDGHTVESQSMASHCRLTSPTGDCSQMHSEVSSDWLPSYIKATQLVLKIFKMAGYFPDRPRIFFPYPHKDWHSSKSHPEFQFLPHREHSQHHQTHWATCDIWGNNWYIMWKIIQKKLKYTAWQNVDFLNVAAGGTYSYHYGSKWICEASRSIRQ